jgi:hypothetical protein
VWSTGLEAGEPSTTVSGLAALPNYQALRALPNRLVGILHGCLRTHTLYDENQAWHTADDNLIVAA